MGVVESLDVVHASELLLNLPLRSETSRLDFRDFRSEAKEERDAMLVEAENAAAEDLGVDAQTWRGLPQCAHSL